MQLTNLNLLEQVELLAAACPWDQVSIEVKRTPEGVYSFFGWLPANEKLGFECVGASGETPEDVVKSLIMQTGGRDPELARKRAIEELEKKIAAFRAVIIGPPPYRPGRSLTSGAPDVKVPETLTV